MRSEHKEYKPDISKKNNFFGKRFLLITGSVLLSLLLIHLMESTSDAAQVVDLSDDDILEAVETELRSDDVVTTDTIDVLVKEGVVHLSGTSFTLLAKRRATRLVGSLKGVRAIVNNIRVSASTTSEPDVREAIRNALRDDPVTEVAEIVVEVQAGAAIISGEVQSHAEKWIAESVVAGVHGVTEIKNEISVARQPTRKDNEIRPEILRRFEYNPYIAEGLIDVSVERGVVKLTGTVGSVNEKELATMLCWVAGVRDVDVSDFIVDPARDKERRRDKFTVLRNDLDLQQAVTDALTYDPRINSESIAVRVKLGAVTLRGNVASLASKRAAQRDAENTLGVRRVINQLKVRVDEWPGDLEVSKRVQAAVDRDSHLTNLDLQASSHFGKAYLGGTVNTHFQKQRAEAVVENVAGVLDLSNRISVDAPWEPKPDEEIQEDTERRLRWSPYLDAENINVAVDNGVVILDGTVDTWHERKSAATHAKQAGAKNVRNRLKVRSARIAFSGLNASLVPNQTVYSLATDPEDERLLNQLNQNMVDVESLPPATRIDVVLRLTNTSEDSVVIRVGHDAGEITLSLVGEGARHVALPRTFAADFRSGRRVTIEPGEHHDVSIDSLQYGFRNASERWYWTKPGEYKLQASFTWPIGFNGIRTYSVDASPVTLLVK